MIPRHLLRPRTIALIDTPWLLVVVGASCYVAILGVTLTVRA